MKKLTFLLALIVLSVGAFAQKEFGGTITKKTYATDTEDANILSQAQSEQTSIVWGSKTKIVNSQQGIGTIIVTDGATGITSIVLDLSQMAYGKYLIKDTSDFSKSKFEYAFDETDTKTLAGYNCKKCVVTVTDLETDETQEMTLYVTDDLMPASYQSFSFPGLKGYPLYMAMHVDNDGNPFTYVQETTSVVPDKKINAKSFVLPAGLEPIENAPEEVKKMFGIGGSDDEEEDDEEY
ncbi:MAG: hypothetical protein MJZ76_00050 [Bacteroidales bacterium]|nr:hypothetical protein [Bacteroidales bacterium]